jgi:predicted phage terminase large subunit-like protein
VTRSRRWYLIDVWRKRVDYPEVAVQRLAAKYKAKRVLVEDSGTGTSLVQELRRGKVSGIVPVKTETDKVSRMAVASAKFECGQVFLPRRAPWLAEFERELFAFPGAKHDDQCDSVSQALSEQNYKLPMTISDEAFALAGRPDPRSRNPGWW